MKLSISNEYGPYKVINENGDQVLPTRFLTKEEAYIFGTATELLDVCKEVLYWLKGGAEPDLKEVVERKLLNIIAKTEGRS